MSSCSRELTTKEKKAKLESLRTLLESLSLSYFVEEGSSESEEYESCDESEKEENTEKEQVTLLLPAEMNSAVTDAHDCRTCREHSTTFLEQQTARFTYLSPMPPIMIDVLRVYYLTKDCSNNGGGDKLELAMLDFVSRKEYSEKYDISTLLSLGFTCEVRLKGSSGIPEKEIYIARALVGYAPFPSADTDWEKMIKTLKMYGGPPFDLFEPVTCIKTVEMYLKLMSMDEIGAFLKPFNGS